LTLPDAQRTPSGIAGPRHPAHARPAEPRDFLFGILWTGLGLAIAIGSWRMDRLEAQGVDPYSVPGLVPGMLGVLLACFGLLLLLRGWRGRPPAALQDAAPPDEGAGAGGTAEPWRIGLALLLCLGFGLGLLGRGPPFWLAAFLFVFLAIVLFELPDRRRDGTLTRGTARAALVAGLGSAAVTFVFQEIFLVRLP